MTMMEDGGGTQVIKGPSNTPVTQGDTSNVLTRNAAALAAFRKHHPERKLQPRGTDAMQDAFIDGYVRALLDIKVPK